MKIRYKLENKNRKNIKKCHDKKLKLESRDLQKQTNEQGGHLFGLFLRHLEEEKRFILLQSQKSKEIGGERS